MQSRGVAPRRYCACSRSRPAAFGQTRPNAPQATRRRVESAGSDSRAGLKCDGRPQFFWRFRMTARKYIYLFFWLLMAPINVPLQAQVLYGSIVGTVTDPSAAVIAKAQIKA